jgi:hypothetical protein
MAFTKEQRTALVGQIVANGQFKEEDKDKLSLLTDNQLVALNDATALDIVVNKATSNEGKKDKDLSVYSDAEIAAEFKSRSKESDDDDDDDDDDSDEKATNKGKTRNSQPKTLNEWMASAPPEIQRIVANAHQDELKKRASLIEHITTNGSGVLSAEDLKTRSTEDLMLFAQLAGANKPVDEPFNYLGAAGYVPTTNARTITPLDLPSADYMKN